MKLIACHTCHTQYDVAEMAPDAPFDCRCGEKLVATPPVGEDTTVQRCSGCGAIARPDDEQCDYCGAGIITVVDRGSLICPECFARNLDDARFCLGCGVAFSPQALEATQSELRCPCCECWMTSREVAGIEIQECPKCHGLWAPEDRFDSLVDRATAAAQERTESGETFEPRVDGGNPASAGVEYRRCPTCDAMMGRRNFQKRSGVIVDRCHEHGTWLDAHELERIAGFVLSGRAANASQLESTLRAERERQAARAASLRARSGSFETPTRDTTISVFGERREVSAVETIFDLLTTLLR